MTINNESTHGKQINIESIHDVNIKNIYSRFQNLTYFQSKSFFNQNHFNSFFRDYFKNVRFIVYKYLNQLESQAILQAISDNITKNISNSIIICTENDFSFIEDINTNIMTNILKETKAFLIDADNIKNKNFSSKEIEQFCKHFKGISNYNGNKFVQNTFFTISLFFIGRFFYPTFYFNDPSFFTYQTKSEQLKFKREFNNLLSPKNVDEISDYSIESIFKDKNKDKLTLFDFNEKEFIYLKLIHTKENESYHMVIHIQSLHIFLMKKFIDANNLNKYQKREMTFSKNYECRFITKFYGFLKEEDQIKGLIFEYLTNGNLLNYIKNNSDKVSQQYIITTIYRIAQGLEYLHSNGFVFRDLKPSNILLDHDNVPYISDVETVRNEEKENKTINLGSISYASPEQDQNLWVSFPTDIYSFGLIIFFLFEHENLINIESFDKKNDVFNQINIYPKCSMNIESLFHKCVQNNPDDRIKIDEVKNIVFDEMLALDEMQDSFSIENDFDGIKSNCLKIVDISQFLFECLFIIKQRKIENELNKYFLRKYASMLLKLKEINPNDPGIITNLGNIFYIVEKDYKTAKNYYEEAASLNNSEALNNLGVMYKFGRGVKKDYKKAREYFDLSLKQNNSYSMYNIGFLYFNGYGEKERNFHMAKKYFLQAVKFNNIRAINHLGFYYEYKKKNKKAAIYYNMALKLHSTRALNNLAFLYMEGNGVDKDFGKAIYYFTKSMEKGNVNAIYNLAKMKKKGQGFKPNLPEAIELFERAAKLGQMDALHHLGNLYFHGKGYEQNYQKAFECYLKSSLDDIPSAHYKLGIMFEKGIYVEQSYKSAVQHYEKAGENGYYSAFIRLAYLFLDGKKVPYDVDTAIQYLKKCAETDGERFFLENNGYYNIRFNKAIYVANNDLGLIYITEYKEPDLNNAEKYLKIAGLNEYPFGLNNIALFYELFCKNNDNYKEKYKNRKKFYEKASEKKFALAFYNLAHNLEGQKDKLELMIEYYKKASENEYTPLIFRGKKISDEQLKLSISYIVFLIDCKLMLLNQSEEKKYFMKIMTKIQNESIFTDIKEKLFELSFISSINKYGQKDEFKGKCYMKNQTEKKCIISDFSEVLFNFINQNDSIKNAFHEKINEIIQMMESVLYTSPYSILFGRFPINTHLKRHSNASDSLININKYFYDGFGDNLE